MLATSAAWFLGHCVSAFVWAADSKPELILEQSEYCLAFECKSVKDRTAAGPVLSSVWPSVLCMLEGTVGKRLELVVYV